MEVGPADEFAVRFLGSLPPAAETLVARLGRDFTPSVLLVGGAVRDRILGEAPVDLDLVVEGPLEPVLDRLGGQHRRHERFATATVTLGEDSFDLARARHERYPRPGALPEVRPATVEEDLARRDFTANAVAFGLTGARRGQLVAWPSSLADIAEGRLRILHDASFRDDPTRLLRLARYRGRLGFEVEPRTRGLAGEAVGEGALLTVTGARLGQELRLLGAEPAPLPGWAALHDLEVDAAIHPGFGIHDATVAARALAALGSAGRPEVVLLACALEGVRRTERPELLDRLAYPARDRDAALVAAADPDGLRRSITEADRPSELLALADERNLEALALAVGHGVTERAQGWLGRLSTVRLDIDGGDLLAAGAKAGPALGTGLRAALAASLDAGGLPRERQLQIALEAVARAG